MQFENLARFIAEQFVSVMEEAFQQMMEPDAIDEATGEKAMSAGS